MTDLFRFMVLRAPDTPSQNASIQIGGADSSALISDLANARAGGSGQESMSAIAQRFIAQPRQFVTTPDSLAYGKQYIGLWNALRQAAASKTDAKTMEKVTKANFPNPARVVSDKGFLEDKRRVQDSIVALQVSPSAGTSDPALLINISRAIDVLERVAADDPSTHSAGSVLGAISRVVVLPPALFPFSSSPTATTSQSVGKLSDVVSAQNTDRSAALQDAIAAIDSMIAVNTASTDSAPEIQPSPIRKATLSNNIEAQVPAGLSGASLQTRTLNLAGVAAPAAASSTQGMSASVDQTLRDLKIDLTKTSLVAASAQLKKYLGQLISAPDPFYEPAPPLESSDPLPTVLAGPPNSHGSVMPAGIADLLVVREHVLRYEPGEIAFVENVAAGEAFKRETVRKNTSLNSTFTSVISSSQTERDLQTSDRFNLQQQAQSVVDPGTAVGASTSSAYGPLVDSAGSSNSSAVAASGFGQEITNRAITNLINSRQSITLQQTTSGFKETVDHGFDNSKTGATPEIVVYQWLDKIVQAKVFSYGKRALYDFVVPEPAVFFAYSRAIQQPEVAQLKKPRTFDLEADTLSTDPHSEFYYQTWAAGYGASNIQPPPDSTITIARAYGDKGSDPQADDGKMLFNGVLAKEDISIPAGYQASKVYVSMDYLGGPPNFTLDVVVGDVYCFFSQTSAQNFSSNLNRHQIGEIPVSISVWNGAIFTVNVEIVCTRTAQALAQWTNRTRDTILQAARDRESEYEDQLRKLTADIQVKYASQNAEQKQTLVRDELEKACVTILSNQHFDALNAIEYEPIGRSIVAQLFLPNVEPVGRYIRFFEQAFEWDQMLYRFLPYFWGRKQYWDNRLQQDDVDSDFAAFLHAGAARVTVPVRKGYEAAVATFMLNGTIPSTSELLAVTTGLYLPFYVELMGSDGAPDTAEPYGDPPLEWELRVPTTLVKIRTDNTLPRWKQKIDAENHVTYVPDLPGDPVNP